MSTASSLARTREEELRPRFGLRSRIHYWLRWAALHFSGTKVADWLGVPKKVQEAFVESKAAGRPTSGALNDIIGASYTPDSLVESFSRPTMNPVVAFHEALEAGGDPDKCHPDNPFRGQKVSVREAWLHEAQVDERGRILRDPKIREAIASPWPTPERTRHVTSNDSYLAEFRRAKEAHASQPKRSSEARETSARKLSLLRRMREDGFVSGTDVPNNLFTTTFDPNQYTEYAPLMGGPFFRQLYIYDFLKQVAYAFEAQNHNPLAKAIVRILTQYALGRRFDVQIEDAQKKKVWEEYERKTDFIRMVCEYWGKECEIYGELDYDWMSGISIDPSTIWDIITDPDRVDIEYYAYQSYPTAYQMFTGYTVPGEPGAEKQAGSDYIIRQIPAYQLVRMKVNCVSNEKRGRSSLFSILGWLKRIKDLFNSKVIQEWLYSSFMWDVTLKNANQGDISAYVSANTAIPLPGSKNIHNEQVEIKALPAISGSSGRGGDTVADNVMAFIAVAVGIPKEFLNITQPGSGSRATALTSAEPFTKMVEDIQARWEWFTTQVFKRVIEYAGLAYDEGDIEVTFPSVTKDTTSETMKNLQLAEEMKWIDHETAMTMAAKELNITQFDAKETIDKIKKDERAGIVPPPPAQSAGRFGPDAGGSEIHGDGKVDLSNQLKTL